MTPLQRPVRFLASVASAGEAEIALAGGADIIDCKDPRKGALGALRHDEVVAVRQRVPRRIPVSATIGDVSCRASEVAARTQRMAETGVDLVKVGIFEGDAKGTIAALGRLDLGPARLAAVLFADAAPDFGLIERMAEAGFAAVMLDTARKGAGPLVDHLSPGALGRFVERGRRAGLLTGLAGSLREADIPMLVPLGADFLGFRGALCREADRTAGLEAEAVKSVRRALDAVATAQLDIAS